MFALVFNVLYNLQILIWFGSAALIISYYLEIDLKEKIQEYLESSSSDPSKSSAQELNYPAIQDVVETDQTIYLHGKSINNPFGVLENLTEPKNVAWIESQLKLTEKYTKTHLAETRKRFTQAYKVASNFESIENPIHFGSTYFFFKRLRPEIPQYSLFSTNHLDIEAKLVFDPNTVRFAQYDDLPAEEEEEEEKERDGEKEEDVTKGMIYIHATWISHDGFKIAYGYTTNLQSKVMNIRVRDMKTGKDLPDVVTGCYVDYTSVTWLESRTGFFYTTQVIHDPTNPNLNSKTSTTENGNDRNSVASTTSTITTTTTTTTNTSAKTNIEKKISNRVLFHRINSNEDFLVFETLTLHDNLIVNTHITSDAHYLLIDIFKKKRDLSCNSFWRSTISEHASASSIGNKVYYFDLTKFDAKNSSTLGYCYKLIDTFAYRFDYISNIEDDFWFRTNFRAPNFRVVRITLPDFSATEDDKMSEISSNQTHTLTSEGNDPNNTRTNAHELDSINFKCIIAWKTCLDWIPQRLDGDYLESATIAAHTVLVLKYLKNSSHEVLLYDLTQNLVQESQIPVADLPHPPHGTINGPNCNFYSSEIFYQYSSFSDPSSVYRALVARDPFNGSIEISFHQVNSTEIPGLDKYQYETVQEFCETKRNVYVPVLKFGNRSNAEQHQFEPKPCILYINGGFGVTASPTFSLPFVLFAEHCDGITVLTNLQGSGMYGQEWAQNGAKENKENAINDLQAVLKFIVDRKYTTPEQIVLMGGTYNGHLIGHAIANFSHMFKSAIIINGIFDLINHHLFNPPIYANLYTRAAAASNASANNGFSSPVGSTQSIKNADLWKYSIWKEEFGCVLESENELNRLLEISPLHNLAKRLKDTTSSKFPSVLILAGMSFDTS